MHMEPEAVASLSIIEIRKIFQIPGRKKKQRNKDSKVKLVFGSISDRDLVLGHAPNLPSDYLVEIVIPDYLQSSKRFLEKFAYKIRCRAREMHETNFSTSICMDDVERSIFPVSYTHLTLPTIYSV